jgi:hypothetical protein
MPAEPGAPERDGLLDAFSKACPTFAGSSHWTDFWEGGARDDEGELLGYLLASAMVRHLTDLLAQQKTDEFSAVFALLERMVHDEDPYVRDLAVVGLIEDMQNSNLHHDGTKPDDFVAHLGTWSKWWWDEVNLFWDGKVMPIGSSGRTRPADMPDPMARPVR